MKYDSNAIERPSLAVTRVRHTLKFRVGRVQRIESLSPQLLRVTFRSPDLQDFHSASFDDHVKLMFPPADAAQPWLPTVGPEGPIFPGGVRPMLRDYTPRRHDAAAGELDIEFVLHDAGPATTWAAQAKVGQHLGIGGPRGSMIIPAHFDWHLLVGDDTALPAIARRLAELPAHVRAIVVIEVSDPAARIELSSAAEIDVSWCYRGASPGGESLLAALSALPALPAGEGYAWAAAESTVVRRIRKHLSEDRKIDKARIRAAAYWKHGAQAVHEVIDD